MGPVLPLSTKNGFSASSLLSLLDSLEAQQRNTSALSGDSCGVMAVLMECHSTTSPEYSWRPGKGHGGSTFHEGETEIWVVFFLLFFIFRPIAPFCFVKLNWFVPEALYMYIFVHTRISHTVKLESVLLGKSMVLYWLCESLLSFLFPCRTFPELFLSQLTALNSCFMRECHK